MEIYKHLLTSKNIVVLREILKKKQTTYEIADNLGMTYHGVAHHLGIILSVYGVSNRRQLRILFEPVVVSPTVILRKAASLPQGVEL